MPINIEGWVEFSTYVDEAEREEENSWLTFMDISSLIDSIDAVSWVLLGNPRDFNNDETNFKPIAKNRGFPNNPGRSLKLDIDSILEHEKKYGKGEFFGFTHFYFSEVEALDWKAAFQISINESDWGKLIDLTIKFKDLRQISADQIRFTVWYNW